MGGSVFLPKRLLTLWPMIAGIGLTLQGSGGMIRWIMELQFRCHMELSLCFSDILYIFTNWKYFLDSHPPHKVGH
jgi:hypothetical protein